MNAEHRVERHCGERRRVEQHCVDWFVVPPDRGLLSGGHLFNRALIEAIASLGLGCRALHLDEACGTLDALAPGSHPQRIWVDTLYLASFSRLHRLAAGQASVGLLLHYLPTLVRLGDEARGEDLGDGERDALFRADAFLVTSAYTRDRLAEFGIRGRSMIVVEPGLSSELYAPERSAHTPAPSRHGVRALVLAALTEGKGVLPWLKALAVELPPDAPFAVEIAGSARIEPGYAHACHELVRHNPVLRPRVTFLGQVPHVRVAALLRRSNLVVSASRMESSGMALLEATHHGVPIVARQGGNVAEHVRPERGGQLCVTVEDLARNCARLARGPEEHARRFTLARRGAPPARPWSVAAQSFLDQVTRYASGVVSPRRPPGPNDQKNEYANDADRSTVASAPLARATPRGEPSAPIKKTIATANAARVHADRGCSLFPEASGSAKT